jgi:hypothetical protein
MIAGGHLRSPEEIREELERGTDGLGVWCKARGEIFAPFDEDMDRGITLVMTRFPDMVDPESDRNKADPFVVALAHVKQGIVVSGESARKHPTGRTKIPDACSALGVGCLKWLDFLRIAEVSAYMQR